MKQKTIKRLKFHIMFLTVAALLLTGCGDRQTGQAKSAADTGAATGEETAAASRVAVDTEFTARDLEVGYEESAAVNITLNKDSIQVTGTGAAEKDGAVTITAEGTYVISGILDNGQVLVDAGDNDKIHIILAGVAVTCKENAPIYIKNADKVFITLKEGTQNTVTDGTEYVQSDDTNVDGAIFSKADLTINGNGTLTVNGNYKHGIVSKDDLVITGGTINVTAVKDALNGKDCVKIKDGSLTLSASTGNGIQSKNDEDAAKGYIYVAGGNITVAKSKEGMEGTVILIDDGVVDITAEDDGLNSANGAGDATDNGNFAGGSRPESPDSTFDEVKKAPAERDSRPAGGSREGGNLGGGPGGGDFAADPDCYISIKNGTIHINASGDGIDSNGSLYISGGSIYVSGPTNNGNGALDYNGTAEITGGTVIAAGSTGMAQGFSDTSSQYSLIYNMTSASAAGTELTLTDAAGKTITSFKPDKQYQSVVISTPELGKDKTYTLTSGEQTARITLTSIVTSNGKQGMGAPGGRGGRPDKEANTEEGTAAP